MYRFAVAIVISIAVAIAVVRFVAIDATSHSASDTLRPWLLQVGVIALLAVLAIATVRRGLMHGR